MAPRPQVRRHLLPQPDRPVRHPKPTPDPDQDHPGARRGGAPGGGPPLLGVRRVRWVRRPFRLDLGRFCRVAGPQTDRGAADSGLLFWGTSEERGGGRVDSCGIRGGVLDQGPVSVRGGPAAVLLLVGRCGFCPEGGELITKDETGVQGGSDSPCILTEITFPNLFREATEFFKYSKWRSCNYRVTVKSAKIDFLQSLFKFPAMSLLTLKLYLQYFLKYNHHIRTRVFIYSLN